jgi:hypothetical protein
VSLSLDQNLPKSLKFYSLQKYFFSLENQKKNNTTLIQQTMAGLKMKFSNFIFDRVAQLLASKGWKKYPSLVNSTQSSALEHSKVSTLCDFGLLQFIFCWSAVAGSGCTASVGTLPTYYSARASLKVVQQLK